jgi:hypothetical protein
MPPRLGDYFKPLLGIDKLALVCDVQQEESA